MLVTTLLMFLDFAWFREQTCIVACPYGRFQSVLLDRQSLIVGYDDGRGEPRERWHRDQQERTAGDCIDCGLCVATCPTGIDIRDGLQMECVACTQCIDACDAVMDRIGLDRGLIRYTSQAELETGTRRFLRPRLVVYTALLAVMFGAFAFSLGGKQSADITLLRGLGAPFQTLPSGEVSNQIRIKIANRSDQERAYRFEIVEPTGLTLVAPENPLSVAAGDTQMTAAFITAPPSTFSGGELAIVLRVADGVDFERRLDYRLLGPSGG
jgi:cytochrome c oxidase accessory protein FixG